MTFAGKACIFLIGWLFGMAAVVGTVYFAEEPIFPEPTFVEIEGQKVQKICMLNGIWLLEPSPTGNMLFHYVDCDLIPHVEELSRVPVPPQPSI